MIEINIHYFQKSLNNGGCFSFNLFSSSCLAFLPLTLLIAVGGGREVSAEMPALIVFHLIVVICCSNRSLIDAVLRKHLPLLGNLNTVIRRNPFGQNLPIIRIFPPFHKLPFMIANQLETIIFISISLPDLIGEVFIKSSSIFIFRINLKS